MNFINLSKILYTASVLLLSGYKRETAINDSFAINSVDPESLPSAELSAILRDTDRIATHINETQPVLKYTDISERALAEVSTCVDIEKANFNASERKKLMREIRSYAKNHTNEIEKQQQIARVEYLSNAYPELTRDEVRQKVQDLDDLPRILSSGECGLGDLLNVLDVSGSMGIGDKHILAMKAVSEIAQRLAPQGQVYAVRFSNYPLPVTGPKPYNPGVPAELAAAGYIGGGTVMSKALEKVLQALPSMLQDKRLTNLLLTFSDFNNNSADVAAMRARFNSIKSLYPDLINWCIAVGTDSNMAMANELCGADHVLKYPNTDAFYASIDEILRLIAPLCIPKTAIPTSNPTAGPTSNPTMMTTNSTNPVVPTPLPTFKPTASPTKEELGPCWWGFCYPIPFIRRRKNKNKEEEGQLIKQATAAATHPEVAVPRSKTTVTKEPEPNARSNANDPNRARTRVLPPQNVRYSGQAAFWTGGLIETNVADRRFEGDAGAMAIEETPVEREPTPPPAKKDLGHEWEFTINPIAWMYGLAGGYDKNAKPAKTYMGKAYSYIPQGRETIKGLPKGFRAPIILGELSTEDLRKLYKSSREKANKAVSTLKKEMKKFYGAKVNGSTTAFTSNTRKR